MYRVAIILILVFCFEVTMAAWDPFAGLVIPISKNAIIETTSGSNIKAIIDGNISTYWESTSPLPDNFIQRRDLNIFQDKSKFFLDNTNRTALNSFDGIVSSKSKILSGDILIKFAIPKKISILAIKLNTLDTVSIIVTSINEEKKFKISPADNYHLITFDLHKNRNIGWIGSRNYNESGIESIIVHASKDKNNWIEIARLNPKSTTFVNHLVSPEIFARYVRVSFTLKPIVYQKAVLHEFEIYDKYGPYGKPPEPMPSNNTFAESFGINTIWGWGYNITSKDLPENTGPSLFSKVAKLARSYHGLDWDIKKPGTNPNYSQMSLGKGTSATPWVNWDEEYSIWKNSGLKIDACIMFNNQYFPDKLWVKPEQEAFDYGKYFADYFNGYLDIVSLVEIGNEPWEYSKPVYKKIMAGMSKGMKAGSHLISVLPCATQAYNKYSDHGNYISEFLTKKNTSYIDGLVTHVYSYTNDFDGNFIAVNPEDKRSEVWSVVNMQSFSKSNLHGIPIYVTEFGYDSDGGNDDCIHSTCVTEFEQAIYGPRMALILYRLGVKEFYWYYYANVDNASIIHNRSGLVSSYSKGFVKKKSFLAFEKLQESLDNLYFHSVIREDQGAYIYSYANIEGKIKKIIAWRPTSNNHDNGEWVEFPLDQVVEDASLLTYNTQRSEKPNYVKGINKLRILLSGIPVLITLK